jgi:hypothetical protein
VKRCSVPTGAVALVGDLFGVRKKNLRQALLQAGFEVIDGFPDALIELHLWFPAEHSLGAGNIRLADLWIIDRQGAIFDL